MNNDSELLHRYVEEGDEGAFTTLVHRHIGLVYSCALRRVGQDAHLAEDLTQKVFCDLARKAPSLLNHPALAGWLFANTQFASAALVRSERRRKARETQATTMESILHHTGQETAIDWDRLRPQLDELLMELKALDRDAVILRFFEKRSFADIAAALGLTEDGARKRVERSVEKLRNQLSRRGVTSGASALAFALTAQAGATVPPSLAAHVAGSALADALAAGTGASVLATLWGAITSGTTAVVATALAGAALVAWQHRAVAALEAELSSLAQAPTQTAQALQQDNLRLARRLVETENLRRIPAALPAPRPPSTPVSIRMPLVPVKVVVTPAGTLLWENERVTLDTFIKRLTDLQSQPSSERYQLLVQAEPGSYFGATSFVVEQASKAGIKNIEINSPARPADSQNWITAAAAPISPTDRPPPSIADPAVHP
ncbi:MAG: sigma-70 family RNA polymerase sigma factor [Opitutaceae bacterium]|nr:sigma-70 family RNA polymerase sigma factor [Opitutaceae bacterium]